MSWIPIDRRSIEIYEEVGKSELFHALDRDVGILIIEILPEIRDETIVIVALSIIGDKVSEECPDTIDPRVVLEVLWRIEHVIIEAIQETSSL